MEDFEPQFRRHFESRFLGSHLGYDQIRSAYYFGAEEAKDSRYRQENWSDVEQSLHKDWETSHPDMGWDDVRDAVFTGWQVAHTTTP